MGRVPRALIDEPELPVYLGLVWDAFWKLHTDRPLGFSGSGPIPHSSVVAYADRAGMEPDEAEWFEGLIAAMDGAYMKWVTDQQPKQKVE